MHGFKLVYAALIPCSVFLASALSPSPLNAEDPVAIVEEVVAANSSLQVMQYLQRGARIRLDASERLVIGYLDSCVRETIEGGSIEVGDRESLVVGGTVRREVVECNGGAAQMSPAQAARSGVIVVRKPPTGDDISSNTEPIQIFSRTPIFRLPDSAREVRITRIDGPTHIVVLPATPPTIDLVKTKSILERGARYEVSAGGRTATIEIAPTARSQGGPLISRLVRM